MKSNDMKRKKNAFDKMNKFSLSFKDKSVEESFRNQKLSNKRYIVLIDAIGMSLIYIISGIIQVVRNQISLSILYFCAFLFLNSVTLIGRKYPKFFQSTIFIHLLAQVVLFTEIVGPKILKMDSF